MVRAPSRAYTRPIALRAFLLPYALPVVLRATRGPTRFPSPYALTVFNDASTRHQRSYAPTEALLGQAVGRA